MASENFSEDDAKEYLNFQDILQIFNCPINEEQAWALCYQVTKYMLNLPTKIFYKILDFTQILLHKNGNISIKFDSEMMEPCATEKEFIFSLGIILYKALDYGLTEDEEVRLCPKLQSLITFMTEDNKETCHGKTPPPGCSRDSRLVEGGQAANVHSMWNNIEKEFKKSYESRKNFKSGSGAEESRDKNPNFQQLMFLLPAIGHRPPISSFTKVDDKKDAKIKIWQKIPQKFESKKRKVNYYGTEKSTNCVTPSYDKFSRIKIEEKSKLQETLENVTEVLKNSCEKITKSLSSNNSLNMDSDENFNFVYEKLLRVPDDELDKVFSKIIIELELIRSGS